MTALQALGLVDVDGIRTWDVRPKARGRSLRLELGTDRVHPDDKPAGNAHWWRGGPGVARRDHITDEAMLPETLDWEPASQS